MELQKTIFSRCSTRKYNDKKISKQTLKEICICGLAAPSANNTKPLELIIIQDKEILRGISRLKPQWYMLKNAAAAILVAGKKDKYFQQNCGAAAENILLAATDQGIGNVWLGLYPNLELVEKIRKIVLLPEGKLPFCFVSLGYAMDKKERKFIYQENKIHWEVYSAEKTL